MLVNEFNFEGNIASEPEVLFLLSNNNVTGSHIVVLKERCEFTDDEMAKWYNVNIKTFRSYKKDGFKLKPNLQEHTLKLISLFSDGEDVFGNNQNFKQWLTLPNIFFDNKKPIEFLNTITGINFLKTRLIAMEYGDNA